MKTGDGAAGNRDEEQRPDRQLFRMQVFKRHFRHNMSANTEEHTAHNAERHHNEADAKERIEPRDDLVDRQQRRHRVVNEDHAQPH